MALLLSFVLIPACSDGPRHPSGSGEPTGDDGGAPDGGAPDAAGPTHPCEGRWDVIVRGDYTDDFAWITTWTSKWVIHADGTTDGQVIPDAAGWPTYEAVGVVAAPGVGHSDGSFTRPADLVSYCASETVAIHVEYSIVDGVFTGRAGYRCPDLIGLYGLSGSVTCGSP